MLRPKTIHRFYVLSLAVKGIDAAAEALGGMALLFVNTDAIVGFLRWITSAELLEDPNDWVAQSLLRLAAGLSMNDKTFFALFLAAHGIIKSFIVIGLLRERIWMFPVGLIGLGGFVVYQFYLYAVNGSDWLLVLAAFDLLIMWLVWREWRNKAGHIAS